MNLEESNSFMQEEAKKDRKKKTVIGAIILCSLMIVVLFCCIIVIQYQDSQTLKMYVNGEQVSISSTMYTEIDGKTYVNVKEMGSLLGYNYSQGEYNQYNEDESSCSLKNDFEIVAISAGEKSFTKYAESLITEETMIAEIPVTVKSENGQAQKYFLENEIKFVEGIIFVPFEAMPDMFNVQLNLSQANRIRIFTLEQVVASTKATIGKLGYTSMNGDYENLKAMIYGLAVVGDGTKFGVISLTDGKEVIGLKYDDITFIPNLQDFLIKAGNTVGIFDSDGNTVIKPTEYDEISVYDEDNQLYLVKKDGKYGILNALGKVVIYPDYDEIGYTVTDRDTNKQEQYKILFNKCIPVKEGTKYGVYNIDGEELLPCVYDEIGSSFSEEDAIALSNEKTVLDIPEELGIQGIVINQNGLYGIYDANAEAIIIPIVCSRVYSVTKAAKTTYYVEFNGQQLNLDEYLEVHNLKSLTVEKEEDVNTEGNADTNTVENETTENVENTEEPPAEEATTDGGTEEQPQPEENGGQTEEPAA